MRHRRYIFLLLPIFAALAAPSCFGWGKDGHKLINRVAAEALPADVPAFIRTQPAVDEIANLGPEPDRWRSPEEPELNAAEAPEHYIDLELAELAAPNGLPPRRSDFVQDLSVYDISRVRAGYPKLDQKLTPQQVGLLPWQVDEDFERLTADMREYRIRVAAHRPVDTAEQAVLYDIGILGHFVADGSQPLHTTIDYNGWVEEKNPEGFTRGHRIHTQFETEFVYDNMHAAEICALVPTQSRVLESPFQDFVAYLHASHKQVDELYRLEKRGEFTGKGTTASRNFTAERMAAGASMLRDMVYTAWLQSAG